MAKTYLLNSVKGLNILGTGTIKRDDLEFTEGELIHRYGIYYEPVSRNYIFAEEENKYHGHHTDDVLKSVAYDLLKIDSNGKAYKRLISSIDFEKDSFIYLHKTYCPDGQELNMDIDLFILRNIPGMNKALTHENIIRYIQSLFFVFQRGLSDANFKKLIKEYLVRYNCLNA